MIHLTFPDQDSSSAAFSREWLETDGRGGYAAGSLDFCHRRKYHGLLVANLTSPPGRQVLVSKFEESLKVGEVELELTAHQFPFFRFPPNGVPLREFIQDLHPSFTYERQGIRIRKSLLVLESGGQNLLKYELLRAPSGGKLRLRPFLAFRGYHELLRDDGRKIWTAEETAQGLSLRNSSPYPPVFLTVEGSWRFTPDPLWYYRFEYEEERRRGYDWQEDLYQPGVLEITLPVSGVAYVSLSLALPAEDLGCLWEKEIKRRREMIPGSATCLMGEDVRDQNRLQILRRAARQFLITSPGGRPAVIAGYPWFTDWARDSLISLPGLAFGQDKPADGLAILRQLARHERDGLLPNFFAEDNGVNPYNTVDSSLWLFWTCQQYLLAGGCPSHLAGDLWPVLKRIIASFHRGTAYGIHVTSAGLLWAGDASTHLTWMDACCEGRPVTSRHGLAVEINALWYNALGLGRDLARLWGEDAAFYEEAMERARAAFNETFWLEKKGYLADVVNERGRDESLRPNQILAVSLPHSPLDLSRSRQVVMAVKENLLTPVGLRTLAPQDPAYRGQYGGNQQKRDEAYHQGTVWPWLLGPFGEALLKVSTCREEARSFLLALLRNFLDSHLHQAGIGSISEIFSGDAPHTPDGCPAQAWSVAEILRLYLLLFSRKENPESL
jgi:predicted glycogen debranching enzyme